MHRLLFSLLPKFSIALLVLANISIVANSQPRAKRWRIADDAFAPTLFNIKTNSTEQTVLHFGASDAWSMQFMGTWTEKQQKQIADWLFSTDTDDSGRPKGIGLSLWRMNLGAGSWEQGDSSQINYGTRTECLLLPNGKWDWSKQASQRKFLKMAKERGVPYLLLFCNSAPVQYTDNGLATNTGRGGNINLKGDCFDDFARFLANATKGIESHDSVKIDYISPVNEPDGHWNWLGPKQEGSPATNREIYRLTREMSKAFKKANVDSKIMLCESSDLRCLLGEYKAGWQRGNTIETLFGNDSAKTSVRNLYGVGNAILGHAYWTNTPVDTMKSVRTRLREKLKALGLDYWQSEVCIMSNDEEIGGGGDYDFSMRTALYVARMIHYDMVYGNACSWSWWRAAGGNYKDGLIRTYTNKTMTSGYAIDSKLLWALGNYSRFVRPGAIRLDIDAYNSDGDAVEDGATQPYSSMLSAYRNTDGKLVVVAINYSERELPATINVDGKARKWQMYRTSDISAESLLPIGIAEASTKLAPRSITTFVEL